MFKSFHALSLGCAPTPIQYFALDTSNLTSLNGLCLGFSGCIATGLYVPSTSSGFELRAVLRWVSPHASSQCLYHEPRMRNHDVIEGIVALAEARETYPYDHFRCVNCAMETCDLNVAEFHDYHIGTCRKRPKASRLALSSSDGGHDIRFNTEH